MKGLSWFGICAMCCASPAGAQDSFQTFGQDRLLFDAESRLFIQQSDDFSTVLGSDPVITWEAEGLTPEQALDLTGLLANPANLTDTDAMRLEGLTSSVEIVLPTVPPPVEPIILPEIVRPELGGPRPVGDLPRRAPICPDGTVLPDFCIGQVNNGSRLCACD